MTFKKTTERVRVTMSGWDGTGYNGEAKERPVYACDTRPGERFVKARFGGIWAYHEVLDTRHEVSGEREVAYFADCE
jgi:hypothetical protein